MQHSLDQKYLHNNPTLANEFQIGFQANLFEKCYFMKVQIESFNNIQLHKIIGFINSLKDQQIEGGGEEEVLDLKYSNDVSIAVA